MASQNQLNQNHIQHQSPNKLTVQQQAHPRRPEPKIFGITLDPGLGLSKHVDNMIERVIEYAPFIPSIIVSSKLAKLEAIQKKAVKIALGRHSGSLNKDVEAKYESFKLETISEISDESRQHKPSDQEPDHRVKAFHPSQKMPEAYHYPKRHHI